MSKATTTIKDQTAASVNQAAASSTGSTSARRGRRVDPNSALSQARVLYRAAHRVLTRSQMVDAFTQELAISRPVANTYFHLIAGPKPADAQPATQTSTPTRARRKKTVQAGAVARGPGRPKGSKNRPKADQNAQTPAAA